MLATIGRTVDRERVGGYLAAERLEDGVVRRLRSAHGLHHLLRQPERRRHELRVLAEQVPSQRGGNGFAAFNAIFRTQRKRL